MTEVDTLPTHADLPAIEESRRGARAVLKLERDVYRDKLLSLGYTPIGLQRWVDGAREGRRK